MKKHTSYTQNSMFYLILVVFFTSLPNELVGQIKRVGVGKVKVKPGLVEKLIAEGKKNEFDRIVQSLDAQITVAMHETRKFKLAAREDMKEVLEEQAISGGTISEIDYILIPTVDDFQVFSEQAVFSNLGKTVLRSTIRFSLLLKIYDVTDAKLLETANIQNEKIIVNETSASTIIIGDLSDLIMIEMAKEVSNQAANRVVDVIFPAKVMAKTGATVTLNRGDGTGIEVGQIWDVYAPGNQLIDPDTGQVLGVEEIRIGKIIIKNVYPKFSKGEAQEDFGIEIGSILRRQ